MIALLVVALGFLLGGSPASANEPPAEIPLVVSNFTPSTYDDATSGSAVRLL